MPCAKGMRQCRALCGHRAIVQDYRDARRAAELLAESQPRTGWAGLDAAEVGGPAVTFRDWLVGRAQVAAPDDGLTCP